MLPRAKEPERLCEKEFARAKSSQEIDTAYRKYRDTIGEYWPDGMLALWQEVYGRERYN